MAAEDNSPGKTWHHSGNSKEQLNFGISLRYFIIRGVRLPPYTEMYFRRRNDHFDAGKHKRQLNKKSTSLGSGLGLIPSSDTDYLWDLAQVFFKKRPKQGWEEERAQREL